MLEDKIKEYEMVRKGYDKRARILLLIGALFLVTGIAVSFFSLMVGIILISIGAMMIFTNFLSSKNKPTADFKNLVISDLLKEICSDEVSYTKNGYINLAEVNASKLLNRPDRISGEDLIVDSYKNVKYGVSDLHLEKEHVRILPNGDSYYEYVTYFKGMFMIFDYPGALKGELYLIPKNNGIELDLPRIDSESIALNERYNIYTTNQEYAFQILTPVCIEKVLALNNIYKGIVSYAFTVDKLYIALNSRVNFLDLPEDKPITQDSIKKLESDLMLPQAIINEFQLDHGKYQR